ncbi:hypothetical protein AKJ09_07844 [Labilithrix luteola]|uniref:Uncharacterized protein n=1 Tax=Labilithrix luteola TaxID=1391654 RepID=A0A0K1Q5S6_9BACT|nr:hypothetical protein AKJ09_07844 [Labilithrix luteola]
MQRTRPGSTTCSHCIEAETGGSSADDDVPTAIEATIAANEANRALA